MLTFVFGRHVFPFLYQVCSVHQGILLVLWENLEYIGVSSVYQKYIMKGYHELIGESKNKYQNEAKGTFSWPSHCMKPRRRVLSLF